MENEGSEKMRLRFWLSFWFSSILVSINTIHGYIYGRWGTWLDWVPIAIGFGFSIILILIWVNELKLEKKGLKGVFSLQKNKSKEKKG